MWRVKALADPDGVLAPGVLLSRDPEAHLHNLKSMPPIHEEATTCVECGFCEPVCPSRWLTTTPRQRIVLLRELARQPDGSPVHEALLEEFEYDGIQTCAADGTCAHRLPARDRHRQARQGAARAGAHARAGGGGAARRPHWAARRARRPRRPARRRGASATARCAGSRAASASVVSEELRARVGRRRCPRRPRRCRRPRARAPPPSTSRPASTGSSPRRAAARCPPRWWRSRRAPGCRSGSRPTWPGHCCGVPWSSKGFARATTHMTRRSWPRASGAGPTTGALPVVIDASSCTHGVAGASAGESLRGARLGRLGARAAAAASSRSRAGSAPPRSTPPARRATWADRRARGAGARAGRRGGGAAPRHLLRLRGRPRLPAPRADRGRHPRGGRGGRRARASTPTCRATAPARSALERATGRPYDVGDPAARGAHALSVRPDAGGDLPGARRGPGRGAARAGALRPRTTRSSASRPPASAARTCTSTTGACRSSPASRSATSSWAP